MFRRCASNSNPTIRVLLLIECVDRVRTLRRFSFDFRLMGYYSRFGRRRGGSSERAAGKLQACRRRRAHIRELNAERRGALTDAQRNGKLEGRNRRKGAREHVFLAGLVDLML